MKSKIISDYSQPEFYRFSEDSVILAKKVVEDFQGVSESLKGLDLCAGCGVVGLEIFQKLNCVDFDFCELQSQFEGHIHHNLELLGLEKNRAWIGDFRNYRKSYGYHLIVANPPYYPLSSGRLPADPKRERCRFFEEGFMKDLIGTAKSLLLPGGAFYLVTPQKVGEGRVIWSNGEIEVVKVSSPG